MWITSLICTNPPLSMLCKRKLHPEGYQTSLRNRSLKLVYHSWELRLLPRIVVPITNIWILFWNQEMNLSSLKNKRQFVTLVLTESNLSTSSLVSVDLLFIYSLQWRLVQWARWRLKSPASVFTQPFIQAQMKENIKALRHWPLWGEFTGDKGPIMREMFPFDDVIMHDD